MFDADSNAKPLVILCEAYDSLREGLELVLGDHYRVVSARGISELPGLLESELPSLVIVDVDYQADLYDVLTRIRAAHETLRILLLACEFSLDQQVEAIRLLGNVSFVTKPFSNDRLLEKIQTLIQGYSSSPIRTRVIRIAR